MTIVNVPINKSALLTFKSPKNSRTTPKLFAVTLIFRMNKGSNKQFLLCVISTTKSNAIENESVKNKAIFFEMISQSTISPLGHV